MYYQGFKIVDFLQKMFKCLLWKRNYFIFKSLTYQGALSKPTYWKSFQVSFTVSTECLKWCPVRAICLSQWFTNNKVFRSAQIRLCNLIINFCLLLDKTSFQLLWQMGCPYINVRTCSNVLESVSDGERELQHGIGPSLLHVVARYRDRVELGHILKHSSIQIGLIVSNEPFFIIFVGMY